MKAASERNKPTEKNNRVGRGKINNMWSCVSQSESSNKSSSSKASVSEGVLFSTKPSFVHVEAHYMLSETNAIQCSANSDKSFQECTELANVS